MTMIIILGLIGIIAIWAIAVYNTLIKKRNLTQEAWSGIDVQLKRRYSLIPNLIESVKGYMGHESKLLNQLTELRGKSMNAKTVEEKSKAEGELSKSLVNLFAIAENYPNLKANENFIHLQQELSKCEDELQLARRYYNGAARDMNISVESFPSNLLAGMFGFTKSAYFEIENAAERETPQVKF